MTKKIKLWLVTFISLFILTSCEFDADTTVKSVEEVKVEEVFNDYIIINISNGFLSNSMLYKVEVENSSKFEKNSNIFCEITYKNSKKQEIVSVVILE